MIRKLIYIFVVAFLLNWAWEILHSALYLSYRGGPITGIILFRAGLADAFLITALYYISRTLKLNTYIVIILGGLIIAAAIELWALHTARWVYNAYMPIVPILNIGLTPLIQLAVTGVITLFVVFKCDRVK